MVESTDATAVFKGITSFAFRVVLTPLLELS